MPPLVPRGAAGGYPSDAEALSVASLAVGNSFTSSYAPTQPASSSSQQARSRSTTAPTAAEHGAASYASSPLGPAASTYTGLRSIPAPNAVGNYSSSSSTLGPSPQTAFSPPPQQQQQRTRSKAAPTSAPSAFLSSPLVPNPQVSPRAAAGYPTTSPYVLHRPLEFNNSPSLSYGTTGALLLLLLLS